MSKTIKFENYADNVIDAIEQAAVAWLHEAAGEVEAQVKRNTAVDTGQLKGSWSYEVDTEKLEAHIGSPLENAIWEEFGTGEFALEGNGRKTPWKYKDAKGKWHTTTGKRPRRALFNAFNSSKMRLIELARKKFKGLK
jgi:hypothetical protein